MSSRGWHLKISRWAAPRYHGIRRPMGGGIKSDATCLVRPCSFDFCPLWVGGWLRFHVLRRKPFFLACALESSGIWGSERAAPGQNHRSFRHDGTTLQEMRRGLPGCQTIRGHSERLRVRIHQQGEKRRRPDTTVHTWSHVTTAQNAA